MSFQRIYTGQGRPNPAPALPAVNPEALRAPEDYRAPPDLAAAVDVALTLGMPLLITGDPGSGKSSLADSVAYELGLGRALRFVVKSDTEARDLFYRFDTVGRFHAANTPGSDIDAGRFISFAALGKAILRAKSPYFYQKELRVPDEAVEHPGEASRSVVLIDEIDKAPRDVPNDILVEIEQMAFRIPELSGSAGRGDIEVALRDEQGRYENRYRPIVIFTSNQESILPEPFLRRCVFFHLRFPPFEHTDGEADTVTVRDIVEARLGSRYSNDRDTLAQALGFFRFLREEARGLERKPMLSELLNWLDYLHQPGRVLSLETQDPATRAALLSSIDTLLLKHPEDQQGEGEESHAARFLNAWKEQNPRP